MTALYNGGRHVGGELLTHGSAVFNLDMAYAITVPFAPSEFTADLEYP